MKLYALYKQATEGDCKTSKPTENMETYEYQKCDSWCKMKGLSKEQAEKQYVDYARNMLTKYGANKLINF
jgi:diazepam-binding inhibitor (GABA receptor modulating acyl-CoA-binding protein)